MLLLTTEDGYEVWTNGLCWSIHNPDMGRRKQWEGVDEPLFTFAPDHVEPQPQLPYIMEQLEALRTEA